LSELVFVGMTAAAMQALEFARSAGHRTTMLSSPRLDFLLTDEQHERVRGLVSRIVTVPDLDDLTAVLAGLRAACLDPGEIDGVLTTQQLCVLPAAQLAVHLDIPRTNLDAIAAARDKARCREILDAAGIPSLAFRVARGPDEALAAADSIGYPVIVKPAAGAAKVNTTIARSAHDVRRHFAALPEATRALAPGLAEHFDDRFLVEELAVGPLYSVEVASDGQAFTPLVVVRRKTGRDNAVLELGSTVPSGLLPADERETGDYAVRACRSLALGLGMYHVEVIRTKKGPRLIEVNPRIAGGAIPDLVTAATGRNLFQLLIELHAQGTIPREPFAGIAGASHSFITAAADCTVRPDLPEDWFEAFRPRIHSGWCSIRPGARLRRMDGNLSVYGVVRVVTDDFQAAENACDQLFGEIEETLGIPLTPYDGYKPPPAPGGTGR
jgi:biotin carboxylase